MIAWILNALALMLIAAFIPGVHVSGFLAALVAVVVIGLINALARPLFVLLTLPVTILTLGLFLFVINALMFYFAGSIYSGFQVNGAIPSLLGSLIYSCVTSLTSSRSKD